MHGLLWTTFVIYSRISEGDDFASRYVYEVKANRKTYRSEGMSLAEIFDNRRVELNIIRIAADHFQF